ncbi:potassium-transporting ATPase C chain [mine drainage metagenome]|uniref:Potassium-transporting ATPase C chain n=1 Tax=mine drainage metagenome TaxID=410659 RepID=A0A1J5PM16_9ZZZZ
MFRIFRPALTLFLALTVLTGLIYPLLVTGLAQVAFPWRANGSVMAVGGKPMGSALIGQASSTPQYFWSRPSATSPYPDNGLASSGSNLGPTNPALLDAVKARIAALRAADPGNTAPIPLSLVTASGSGLDPDISLAAAEYQRDRVARTRHLSPEQVQALIDREARKPWPGVFGEPRVNVLALNLALDKLDATHVD